MNNMSDNIAQQIKAVRRATDFQSGVMNPDLKEIELLENALKTLYAVWELFKTIERKGDNK